MKAYPISQAQTRFTIHQHVDAGERLIEDIFAGLLGMNNFVVCEDKTVVGLERKVLEDCGHVFLELEMDIARLPYDRRIEVCIDCRSLNVASNSRLEKSSVLFRRRPQMSQVEPGGHTSRIDHLQKTCLNVPSKMLQISISTP